MATDNKPKLQLDKDNKIIIDNETNKQNVIQEKSTTGQLNEPVNTVEQSRSARLNDEFEQEKSPSQKKVDLLNKIRDILKTAGADSQQNYKALQEIDMLLFNGDDELDYNGREQKTVPETGNEPAGTANPNIKVPEGNSDKALNKEEK